MLPAGCLPAAGRAAHGRAGETPRAGRRGCHGGDCARYPCMPPVPLPLASPGHRHPPLLHIFQASSSPGHRTYLACCGRRSTPSWSCRYWHPSLTGLPAPAGMLAECSHRVGPAMPVLQRHGLRVLPRDPYSFTPLLEDRSRPRSLLLGHDMAQTQQQIAQFSQKDAQVPCGHGPDAAKPPRD